MIVRHASARVRNRNGLSLFEVLLALAIFAGATAVIGQLLAGGVRGAIQARLQTQAILRCESKLAEVVASAQPFIATPAVAFSDDPDWSWAMSISNGPHPKIFLVEVTVTCAGGQETNEISFTLQRLMRNPQAVIDPTTTSSFSGSGTSSTGSGR